MKIYLVKNISEFDERFVEKCISFFPEWRKEQMLRYNFLKGRVQNAVAYLLLIYALKSEGILNELPEFSYNEHDKPFMKNYPDWYFYFSHSKTAVCCVLSKNNIGIDIEEVAAYKESVAAYISSDEEFNLLNKSDDKASEFYKLWTRKEAVSKYIGSGITGDIKNVLNNTDVRIISKRIDDIWMSVAY